MHLSRAFPLIGCAVLAAATAAAQASPEADPLGRLVVERGWAGPSAHTGAKTRTPAAKGSGGAQEARALPRTPPAAPDIVDDAAAAATLVSEVRGRAADLLGAAVRLVGVPYRRGGNSIDTGFDCSGFTRHVFESSLGLVLPRRSSEQAQAAGLKAVLRRDLRPGDLVFFNTLRSAFSHVGIYLGNHKFIHAPRTGGQIRVEDLRVAYWTDRFTGGRRAAEVTGEPGDAAAGSRTTASLAAPQD